MMQRCLFVEGSDVVRKVARRILEREGLVVEEARDGHEAVARCAAAMPDLIIVDSLLPDMTAPELIRHVRAMQGGDFPRILAAMIEMDIGAIMRAKRAGAQGYLLKPFDRQILMGRINAIALPAAAAAA